MFDGLPLVRILMIGGSVLLVTLAVRMLLFRFVPPLVARRSELGAELLVERGVLRYASLLVPGLLVAGFAPFLPVIGAPLITLIQKLALSYTAIIFGRLLIAILYAVNDYYNQRYDFSREVPIKPLIQTADVLIILLVVLVLIAIILGVPLLALASVIAVLAAAVTYLFREPLLGFAASLQISLNRMMAIGDWIEIDQYGVNGEVLEINITSTKVRNWDNAIVNVPTYDLITVPFTNWHDMQSKQARRVLRPLYIDQTSIAYLDPEQQEQFLAEIKTLFDKLPKASRENIGMEGVRPPDLAAAERLTNLELFMAYATMLIAGHPQTRSEYDCYVRQQDPTPQGLPVQVYFFTRATAFVSYNAVQRELISSLLAEMGRFELRPFQTIVSTTDPTP